MTSDMKSEIIQLISSIKEKYPEIDQGTLTGFLNSLDSLKESMQRKEVNGNNTPFPFLIGLKHILKGYRDILIPMIINREVSKLDNIVNILDEGKE